MTKQVQTTIEALGRKIERLGAELAAEKAKRANMERMLSEEVESNVHIRSTWMTQEDAAELRTTVEQQSAVIERMRDALQNIYAFGTWRDRDVAKEALTLQPSFEILRQRNERVKEMAAKVCEQQDTTQYPRTAGEEFFSTATAVCAAAIRAMEIK